MATFKVNHITKSGTHISTMFADYEQAVKKVQSLFKQRLEAQVFLNSRLIGRVWKDNTQVKKWNYSIESPA